MKIIYPIKIVTAFIITVLMVQSCNAQSVKKDIPVIRDSTGIYKEAQEYGLKGTVKSIKSMLYKGNGKDKIVLYKYLYGINCAKAIFSYSEFNNNGNRTLFDTKFSFLDSITAPIKDKYIDYYYYYEKDISKKARYKPLIYVPYPAYNPFLIHLNQYESEGNPWDGNANTIVKDKFSRYIYIYIYIYNEKNRIKQEVEYLYPFNDKVFKEEKIDKYYIYTRTIYEYDNNDRLVSQKIIARENDRDPMFSNFGIHNMDLSIFDDFRRTFQYDEENRLKNVSLYVNNKLAFSETYEYAREGYISEVKRFIISKLTNGWFPGDNVIEKYDENGNITETQILSENGKEIVKTRYYEYTLDAHKNWVECRMYLEGRTQEPTLTARRIIEYYDK